jgi:hypothetical protein
VASSNTTSSCGGRITLPLPTHAVEVGVDDDDLRRLARSRLFGEARPPIGQRSAPGHSSLPTLTARHAAARRPVQLGGVADVRVRPAGDAGDLSSVLVAVPSSSSWPV